MIARPIAEKAWLPDDCRSVIADLEGPLTKGSFDDIEARVMDLIDVHERHMDVETIGLNAGTNVMNPRAAALLGRSLGNRPSLGFPGDKYEMGMQHAEKLEIACESLVKRLFDAPFAEIRVPSGPSPICILSWRPARRATRSWRFPVKWVVTSPIMTPVAPAFTDSTSIPSPMTPPA